MNYVLFFGSLLLVMSLPWLAMPSDQPSAPARTYRNAFLVGLALMSASWCMLWMTHLVSSSSFLLVFTGALIGGITTTAVDTGVVQNAVPLQATEDGARHPVPRLSVPQWSFAGAVALIGLVLTLPLWVVIAAFVWIEDPGPVFVLKNPPGKEGVTRRRLAFRSTRCQAEGSTDPVASPVGGPRSLAVGALLRRTRLDDLPGLINILAVAVTEVRRGRAPGESRPEPAGDVASVPVPARWRRYAVTMTTMASAVSIAAVVVVAANPPASNPSASNQPASKPESKAKAKRWALAAPMVVPQRFDPAQDAVLPRRRVVAFYGVPGAGTTGPAWTLDSAMLDRLRAQGAEYERLDPAHPVALGIDLVASVPDSDPGPAGTYSHRLDKATLDRYVEFCRANGLLLFLDLSFGWSDPRQELDYFLPYLALPFVHLAIDPEWMFPRRNGVPGVHLSNVRAADLNPLITAMGDLPAKHRIPRKIVIVHQYRPTGDGLPDPFSAGAAEIADKGNLVKDPRVDVVMHVDSVGGWAGDIQVKTQQYESWVRQDMARFGNFQYGGFKIFYQLEAKNRLMTPREVMALQPPPLVVTYGN